MYISLEGPDNCGKSTQFHLLTSYFANKNIPHKTIREPGGTQLAESIRTVLLNTKNLIDPHTEFLLFTAARRDLTKEALQAIKECKHVLSDRCFLSSYVYQGHAGGVPINYIKEIIMNTIQALPDSIIIIDVDRNTCEERSGVTKDRMELKNDLFKEKVDYAYRNAEKLFGNDLNIEHVDGTKSPDEVHRNILRILGEI